MKWVEGKYEKRWRHTDNYYAWQDISRVVAVTFIVSVIITCVIMLLFCLTTPRQTSADDWVNLRVAKQEAQVSSTDVSVAAKPKTLPAPVKSVSRASKPVKILYMEVSAYSPTAAECDGNPLRTASGKTVYVGGIAADLRVLPFGSLVRIPSYNGGRPCEVIDTGSMIRGNTLDVFFWKSDEAVHWGRRHNVPVEILRIGGAK